MNMIHVSKKKLNIWRKNVWMTKRKQIKTNKILINIIFLMKLGKQNGPQFVHDWFRTNYSHINAHKYIELRLDCLFVNSIWFNGMSICLGSFHAKMVKCLCLYQIV